MEDSFNLIDKNNLDEETIILEYFFIKLLFQTNIKNENMKYMESHPELKDLLNDFISSILLHTPDDIFKYANEYFSNFKKKTN
ncbi:hypothetical protein PFNF135_03956 [Plasmodium falciparum NF135/5.C10]|uniref:RIIa domain-containing protein n=1 Tax=Plasmodium falciparum NF135/5.C10 TaxID=1036726 RepID=W4IFH8_PLAFA|nr:hypothetical protein PFNF135_03956 [Plasmodium falciparum NF135/5.C10]